jgi:hypothetical protein
MARKDETIAGLTGQPVPKPRSAKKQYELEKKRRQQKHLGKNVGGHQYSSDVNPYYNPRQRTFEEFMSIVEQKIQQEGFSYSDREFQDKLEKTRRERKQKEAQVRKTMSDTVHNERVRGRGIRSTHNGQSGWMKDGKFTPD